MTQSGDQLPVTPGTGVLLAGRYRLTARIGRGGTADVFEARDELLHRAVAIKLFRVDSPAGADRRRVEAEARTLASLRNPGLVAVYDAGTPDGADDGTPFLVMELVRGSSLLTRLADGPLSERQVALIGAEVATTLGYVHSLGIVHRDVKPANILLDEPAAGSSTVSAKLTDFGIARLLDSTRMTMEGMTIGTANYLSPEQAEAGPVGAASDLYSFGLVLIECLTGRLAFPGLGVEAALARLHRQPLVPSEFGPAWTELLTALTARDPGSRPTALQAAGRLRLLSGQPADSGVAGIPESDQAGLESASTELLTPVRSDSPGARRRRSGWLCFAAGILALVVMGTVLVARSLHSGDGSPAPRHPAVPGQLGHNSAGAGAPATDGTAFGSPTPSPATSTRPQASASAAQTSSAPVPTSSSPVSAVPAPSSQSSASIPAGPPATSASASDSRLPAAKPGKSAKPTKSKHGKGGPGGNCETSAFQFDAVISLR